MKTYLECYPCFLRQALDASRFAAADESQQLRVMQQALTLLQNLNPAASPPEIAWQIHRLVREEVASSDPYQAAKERSTRQSLALYPQLKALVSESDDPLGTALRLSIAGNIIDLGVQELHEDLWENVERVLSQPYAVDHETELRAALASVDQVLFLADNAGETVFDRVLIEELPLPVTYVVKGHPILNDATRTDALAAGLDSCSNIIDNGSDAPGTVFKRCSAEFMAEFERSALVIAKGQANYETLSTAGEKVFCLLQVKCPVIGLDIGAPVGSIIIRNSKT